MLCIRWDYKGVVYHEFLEPGKTVNTVRYREQMINLYHALIKNVARRVCKTRKSDFAIRQRPIWHSNSNQTTFLHLSGNSCLARRTHQTWALPTTTCFHWCLTHISWNTSTVTEMSKNGLMKKVYGWSGRTSTNCQRDGKNVSLAI